MIAPARESKSDMKLGLIARRLPAPTPAAAPPASPSAAASKESHHEEQQYRTNGSVEDCTDHARTEMDAKLSQQPTSDKGAQNTDNKVANDPKTGPSHDLTCQPACNQAHKQYYQQTFTRHIHCVTSAFWLRRSITS
jgi:hypothetical protein